MMADPFSGLKFFMIGPALPTYTRFHALSTRLFNNWTSPRLP